MFNEGTMTMKNIAVFTGTRAEYGILYPLLKALDAHAELNLQLIVSAMHLSPEFGCTVKDIVNDGFEIAEEVEMLLSSNTAVGCAKSVGVGMISFADSLNRLRPDILVVLGDRFEALAIAQTAMLLTIPVAHLHGGEITKGAKDDAIRHAITKLSNLHFTANQAYSNRVIQLGEAPESVHCVGSLGLENITKCSSLLSKSELQQQLNFDLGEKYFLLTYHSATLAEENPVTTFKAIFAALAKYPAYKILVTYPNADEGGRDIISLIMQLAEQFPERIVAIPTLGFLKYFSALKYAAAVIGNSSSGIIEVPAFNIPSINIGQRQQGRMAAASVIHCSAKQTDIEDALQRVDDGDVDLTGSNPYALPLSNKYKAQFTSDRIVELLLAGKFSTQKSFYDLPFSVESSQKAE
tara:strand:+ start:51 stop:1274 length:1224 start_codon:yes stop_codon:yes gene_type:complete